MRRSIVVGLVIAGLTSEASSAGADEPKRVPDVRVGIGGELGPLGEQELGVVVGASARPIPWLSLGIEGVWSGAGYSWNLDGPQPLARNPFHVAGVVRGHVLLDRHVEGSFGVLFGWAGERWLYRDSARPELGEYAQTRYGVGSGVIVGLHFFPVDAIGIDAEGVFFSASLPDDVTRAVLLRLGLSYHFR